MKRVHDICPMADEIEKTLLSVDDQSNLDAIAEHLTSCESCRRIADAITEQSSLEHEICWATDTRNKTQVDVQEPLRRLEEILVDYQIIEELGRGGMGIVYRARQKKLDRPVAIKVLPALIGVVRPESKARFRREAELAAALEHTNIIGVYDYDEVDGTHYYVMQLIDGPSLRDILSEIDETGAVDVVLGSAAKPRGDSTKTQSSGNADKDAPSKPKSGDQRTYFRTVAQWMADVADAMHYAHEHGVIHRDIKPSNLLLAKDRRLMISDFGLARPSNQDALTLSQTLIGTCRYMSPEQIDPSRGAVDRQIDVYGLGATLYELLAFRPMFGAETDREVMNQVLREEPTPPSRYRKAVPAELETICLKAVAKDRAERYRTARDLADDLRRWLLGVPIHAKKASPHLRAVRFLKRNKTTFSFFVVAIASLTVAGFFLKSKSDSDRRAVLADTKSRARFVRLQLNEAQERLAAGDFSGAISEIDSGLEQSPTATDLLQLKARIAFRMGRWYDAIEIVNEIVKQEPGNWQAHYIAGFAHSRASPCNCINIDAQDVARSSRNSEAFQYHFDQVRRLNPGSAEDLCLQACAESDRKKAIRLLDKALHRRPDLGEARLLRASLFGGEDDNEAMLADTDAAIDLAFGGALVHGQRGSALALLDRFPEAEDAFTKAIHLDPENVHWWYNRSVARVYQGKLNEAMADADQAILLDPDYSFAYVARGKAYAGLRQFEKAHASFNHAAELKPDLADVYAERCLLNRTLGDFDASIADSDHLMKLAPNDLRGYQYGAVAKMELLRYDEAISDLDRSLEIQESEDSMRIRAAVKYRAAYYESAIEDFTAALKLRPGFVASFDYRGRSYFRLGQYQEAVLDFSRWIDIGADLEIAHMRRGMAYEMIGESHLALADYEKAAELHPAVADYTRIWKYILYNLHDESATTDEVEIATIPYRSQWPQLIASFFRHEITDASLIESATNVAQKAEALYYAGARSLIDGDVDAAVTWFSRCVELDQSRTLETDFAFARLRKLRRK